MSIFSYPSDRAARLEPIRVADRRENRHGTFSLSDNGRDGSSALRAPPCPFWPGRTKSLCRPSHCQPLPAAEIKGNDPLQKSLKSERSCLRALSHPRHKICPEDSQKSRFLLCFSQWIQRESGDFYAQTGARIKGLTVNIKVVKMSHADNNGGILCYIAPIYVQPHGSADKMLVRKSRLPGAAAALKAEVKRGGLRAFDRLRA